MKSLASLINDLEQYLPYIDQKNEKISQATVGWHIEHSLLALVKMISATEHSDPAHYRRKFNLKRLAVLSLGMIPRGRATVPDSTKPGDEINEFTILPLLEKARQKTEKFEKLSNDKFFTHPVFGDLRTGKARRIIAIHTYHHIKIIKEILNGINS